MSVHEQHYPPQTMPQIKRLLVNIPVRNVVDKVYCKYQTLVLQNQIWNSSNFLTFLSRWCALITRFFFSLIPMCFAIACNNRLFFVPIVLAKSNYRCCEVFYIVVVVISTTILLALYLRLGAITYPITVKLSFFRYCLQDDIHKNSL